MTEQRGPIWLAGMMGAGKSSVGSALAKALGVDFFDTDREVESQAAITVAAIFERDGAPVFRDLEAAVIESLSRGSCVISLGGGALMRAGTTWLCGRIESTGPPFLSNKPSSSCSAEGCSRARCGASADGRRGRDVTGVDQRR